MGKEGHRDARRDLGIVRAVLSWLCVWVDVVKFIHLNQEGFTDLVVVLTKTVMRFDGSRLPKCLKL